MTESRRPNPAVLIVVTMAGTMAMNVILPSLPGIEKEFATSVGMVSLTLSLFLVALAVGQLVFGPLSDRFGRRPMLLGGLFILLIGTVICLMATSIEVFILGRVVQAGGGCAGIVMGRAMVRDLHDTDKSAAMIAYLTMATVVVPTVVPLIGGYLDVWYGWRAGIVFILVVALAVFAAALLFAYETLPLERRHEARFAVLFGSYRDLLRNPLFDGYAFQLSFNTAAYFAFFGGSSAFLVKLMGLSEIEMGYFFIVVSAFYITGNFGTARLVQKLGFARVVTLGTSIAMIGATGLPVMDVAVGLNHISFTVIMSVLAFGNGFCISSGIAGAISADPSRVGAASGLAGSMQLGISAFTVHYGGALVTETVRPLLWIIFIATFLALLSAPLGRYVHARRSARNPD